MTLLHRRNTVNDSMLYSELQIKEEWIGWPELELLPKNEANEWIGIPRMTLCSGGWQVKEEWGMSSTRVGFFLLPKQDEDEEDDEEFVITPR